MPKIDIDWRPNIGSLINAAILLLGFLAAAAAWVSDRRLDSEAVKVLQQQVSSLQSADSIITSKITEGQQSTTNRLSTLETQNVFILRSLDRLETAIRDRKL